jgi:hypothetical protein
MSACRLTCSHQQLLQADVGELLNQCGQLFDELGELGLTIRLTYYLVAAFANRPLLSTAVNRARTW